ncbi:MAG TPA: amidohydrolase family protein [Sphingopyxis sp.]|uniref:amidohydrolase family protein n=1 Tax=Sphingopyxis sp. TaxID=1908224 RepID=UPI002CE05A09|nr:amidohydrolase family protein [Sphingopyxis sp.]HWW58439.1 amidohydrolase family protein [Sphingopyxis sp.]
MADGSAGPGIIDICAVHGDRDVWEAYLTGFAIAAPDYLDKFAEPLTRRAGVDLEDYRRRLAADPHSAVHYLIDEGSGFDVADGDYIAGLRADGITHQVLHGFPWRGRSGADANRSIARLAAMAPDLLTCWLGVSLRAPEEAASQIESALRDWNIGGVSVSPFWEAVPASDPALTPIFETAQRLNLPIWIHAGQNFNRSIPLDISHVRNIDRVATAFPDLTILIGHGGWPWISDAVAIVQRHPNVHLELSSHSPRFMGRAGSGWEPLLAQARGALRGRILFGASAWVSRLGPADLAAQIDELGLPADIAAEWRHDNAAWLLAGAGRRATD